MRHRQVRGPRLRWQLLACLLPLAAGWPALATDTVSKTAVEDRNAVDAYADAYVERYLETFPTRATAAGDPRRDHELEDLSQSRLADWLEFNRRTVEALSRPTDSSTDPTAGPTTGSAVGAGLDAAAVLRHARREVFRHHTLEISRTQPLFWTGIVGAMSAHLLVRDDQPLETRLRALALRVDAVPRLCAQARDALGKTSPDRFAREPVETAVHQARAAAAFFAEGLPLAADAFSEGPVREELRRRLGTAGDQAAAALSSLAEFLDGLAATAVGSPRLGNHYAESFRLGTGDDRPIAAILADAELRLATERAQVAAVCRSLWHTQAIDRSSGLASPPVDDAETVRACFARIASDHVADLDQFVADYRRLAHQAEAFVAERGVVDLPAGFRLVVDRSPAYLVGQSVGGVYPPGPYSPTGAVLLFVPSYPDDTPTAARAAFHRDFNDHFNTMITPHETVPGHGAQVALAAHRAQRTGQVARELFADGVFVEGWGTFSERLMLDLGWGSPLARVAHLKKRLENIARLIVDIRVHTTDIERDEIVLFVQEEALQDAHFAANMWRRALLSSPQLASYDLGSQRIEAIYEAERRRLGEAFDIGDFVRAMNRLGSVPVAAVAREFDVDTALLDSAADTAPPSLHPEPNHGL